MHVTEAAPTRPLDTVKPSTGRTTKAVRGAALMVAGMAVIWVGLDVMSSQSAFVKMAVTCAGLAAMFRGFSGALKAWRGPLAEPLLWLCTGWLILLALAAIFADLLPFAVYNDPSQTLTEPGFARPDLFSAHPLGTNKFALDLLAQSIYGARVSLLTALVAVGLSATIGVIIGVLAGYFRGPTDMVVGVGTDALLSYPPLILLVALAAVFGVPTSVADSVIKSGFALALVGIPSMVRLARANTMVFARREFVLAGQSMGASNVRIMFKELIPNVAVPVASYAFVITAVLIIAEGSLSFLGLGLQQPEPTWGNMIAQADLTTLRSHPHVALVPGGFMFLTVYAFSVVGDVASRRWDPKAGRA